MRSDIIIVNYLSADDVARCLKDLGGWDVGDVWVVNNSLCEPGGDIDHERLLDLTKEHANVRVLAPPINLGFSGGCNFAYSLSQAQVVVLLNPDAIITKDDLHRLIDLMQEDSGLGALSPAMFWNLERSFLVPPTVRQTPASTIGLALSTRLPWLARWLAKSDLAEMKRISCLESVHPVDFLTGAVLLVRRDAARSAAKEFGLSNDELFDPDYFMFFEDSDLSVRLRRTGWRLGIAPHIRAMHEYRHKQYKLGLMAQSRDTYFRKCFPRFFKMTQKLTLIDRLNGPVLSYKRHQSTLGRVTSANEFSLKVDGAAVLALSPSLLGRPALFRPSWLPNKPLSDGDWSLIEPGHYVALIESKAGEQSWRHFERAFPI